VKNGYSAFMRRANARPRSSPTLRLRCSRAAPLDEIRGRADELLARSNPIARIRLEAALSSLLAVSVERERLQAEAVDAEALRRSDAIKTAVLQSVSA